MEPDELVLEMGPGPVHPHPALEVSKVPAIANAHAIRGRVCIPVREVGVRKHQYTYRKSHTGSAEDWVETT